MEDPIQMMYDMALEIARTYGEAMLEAGLSWAQVEDINNRVLRIKTDRMKAEQPEVYGVLKDLI